MKSYKHGWLILTVCQAVVLSGCTSALWEKERFARCHWPANPPNLRLFYSEPARDVLAEYDEASEGTTTVQRRAYWLEPNALAVTSERQPLFVSVANTQDLVVVPVTNSLAGPPPSAHHGPYAVVATANLSFSGSGQRVKQVLLTPFAVATDLTVVGGVVCLIVCYVEANRCP